MDNNSSRNNGYRPSGLETERRRVTTQTPQKPAPQTHGGYA